MEALFFLSDHKYWPLTRNAILSFQETNSWFTGDINVLFCDGNPPKDQAPSGVNFLSVDYEAYNSKHFKLKELLDLLKVPEEKRKTLFKIDVFKHHDRYDKILFSDSDCLFLGSVKPLFESDESRIFFYKESGLTNSGVFYTVNNLELYPLLLSKISQASRRVVEEPIFSKYLKSFSPLEEKYNDYMLRENTVIYHMQNLPMEEVLRIQNERHLL